VLKENNSNIVWWFYYSVLYKNVICKLLNNILFLTESKILKYLMQLLVNVQLFWSNQFILVLILDSEMINANTRNTSNKLISRFTENGWAFIVWNIIINFNISSVMSDQLVRETMLPGLRCLQQDMIQIAPEHDEVIQSMIKDYETKMELSRSDR
jgi:hypothetical protein